MKSKFILFFIFILFIIFSAYSYVSAVSNNISNSVFRLHVIANSNSVEDQALKYKVRDGIIQYMNSLSLNINSKEESMILIKNNLSNFKEIASNIIKDNGFNYDVNIEIGNFSFPTKYYGDISFPAGYYDALKVKIGNANGENWWCVMFPPLCFVDTSSGVVPNESKSILSENMNFEDYSIISNNNTSDLITFKFKIIELFENISIQMSNN